MIGLQTVSQLLSHLKLHHWEHSKGLGLFVMTNLQYTPDETSEQDRNGSKSVAFGKTMSSYNSFRDRQTEQGWNPFHITGLAPRPVLLPK